MQNTTINHEGTLQDGEVHELPTNKSVKTLNIVIYYSILVSNCRR